MLPAFLMAIACGLVSKALMMIGGAVISRVAAMNGVFTSLDFLLFYVSWEVLLVPMLALIGIWGGEQRRYAALKFFVYTLAGSVLTIETTNARGTQKMVYNRGN